ncbi:MAG: nitrous oxide reductase accessory protein NosL [Campylobacteraceae bacterium]
MKKFNKNRRSFLVYASLTTIVFATGCEKKIDLSPKKITYDRDVCERCKMVISAKNYVAQVINPNDGKHYNFDDIGCAILWFKEKNLSLEHEAVIYVADANTSKLIDAKKAFFIDGANTPMNYGFAAHENKQEDRHNFDYEYVKKTILEKRHEKKSPSHHQH